MSGNTSSELEKLLQPSCPSKDIMQPTVNTNNLWVFSTPKVNVKKICLTSI